MELLRVTVKDRFKMSESKLNQPLGCHDSSPLNALSNQNTGIRNKYGKKLIKSQIKAQTSKNSVPEVLVIIK